MAESPYYRFYRRISFAIPFKQWHRVPRVPGYRNEYWDGKAQLSPRPDTCDMLLDLAGWSPPGESGEALYRREEVVVRPLHERDWGELPRTFLSAFGDQPPLSGWGKHAALRAARCIMQWAHLDRDAELLPGACFAAWTHDGISAAKRDRGAEWICGAALVGLVPGRRLCPAAGLDPDSPGEAPAARVPHLDWMFVNRWMQRQGIGTMLLESVVCALRDAGFRTLASTSLQGNTQSLLWHWRNGFKLARNDCAMRRRRRSDGPVAT